MPQRNALIGSASIGRELGLSQTQAARWLRSGRIPGALIRWRRNVPTWVSTHSLLDKWVLTHAAAQREVSAHSPGEEGRVEVGADAEAVVRRPQFSKRSKDTL